MDEDLGLSDRDKELKKWNAPYVYREYPRMLYRGTTATSGLVTVEQRVVGTEGEQATAGTTGWVVSPQVAVETEDRRQEAVGVAAAERAYRDRQLSGAAQAEAEVADTATARHLPEIPARPRRPSRAKPSKPQE